MKRLMGVLGEGEERAAGWGLPCGWSWKGEGPG